MSEALERARARGQAEILRTVQPADLAPGDYIVHPTSMTGLPPVYSQDNDGYVSYRPDCGLRYRITGNDGVTLTAELISREGRPVEPRTTTQPIPEDGHMSALKVIKVDR